MKVICRSTGEVLGTVLTNHSMTLDEALDFIRNGEGVNFETLNLICEILDKQPGEIIRWIPDKKS